MDEGTEPIIHVLRLHMLIYVEKNTSHPDTAAFGTDVVRLGVSLPGHMIFSGRYKGPQHLQFGLPVTAEIKGILEKNNGVDLEIFSLQTGASVSRLEQDNIPRMQVLNSKGRETYYQTATTAPGLVPTPVTQTPPPTEITRERDGLIGQDASAAEIASLQEELTLELDARAPLLTTKYPYEIDRLVAEATTEITYFTRGNDASPLEMLGMDTTVEYLEFLARSAEELGRDIPNNVFTRSLGAYDIERWEYPLGDFDWDLYKRNLALIQTDGFRNEFLEYLQSEEPMVRHWTADEMIPLQPRYVETSYPSSTGRTSEDLRLLMDKASDSVKDILQLHVLTHNGKNTSHPAVAPYATDMVRLTLSSSGIVIISERFNHKAKHTQFGLPVTEELRKILGPRISDDIDVFSVQLGANKSSWQEDQIPSIRFQTNQGHQYYYKSE